MTKKMNVEEELKDLKKHMGSMVKLVKELKAKIDALEKKEEAHKCENVEDILNKQKAVEENLAINSENMKSVELEMNKIQQNIVSLKQAQDEANEKSCAEAMKDAENIVKQCRYNNKGYCKYKLKCKFEHSKEVCQNYLKGEKCTEKSCKQRHPKVCKWWQGGGCKIQDCDYLHVTLVSDDRKTNNAHEDLSCFSCKNNYNDRTCVVEHVVEHMRVYLCLNCDGWIQEKQNIMNPGWSLYDNFGQLRRDI